jgi:hypothetical protein
MSVYIVQQRRLVGAASGSLWWLSLYCTPVNPLTRLSDLQAGVCSTILGRVASGQPVSLERAMGACGVLLTSPVIWTNPTSQSDPNIPNEDEDYMHPYYQERMADFLLRWRSTFPVSYARLCSHQKVAST